MTKIKSLRRKYVNSTLTNKTCSKCGKTYPRTPEFFYLKKRKGFMNKNILIVRVLDVTTKDL
jgi:hypothetical protein